MQIRTFDAATVERAQAAVRAALGVDALILATEETAQGVRITAAVEPDDDLAGILGSDSIGPDRRLGAVMAFHGIPPGLRAALAEGARGFPLEAGLAQTLHRHMTAAVSADRRLLVGPPGHGRTLAAARLALAMQRGGSSPRVVTLHPAGTALDGRLAAWLEGSGIPVLVVADRQQLREVAGSAGPLLVDTAGVSTLSSRSVAGMRDIVAAVPDAAPTLVLSTEGSAPSLLETTADFLTLGCRAVLATKLDLTRRYGGLVALACGGVALLPASVSGEVDDALAPLQPSGLARLLVHRFETYGPRPSDSGEEHPA